MFKRRRVALRLLIWSALAVLVLLVAAYRYVTNPVRLRAWTLAALRSAPIDGIDVAEVAFSPWEGLQLSDVVVAPKRDTAIYRQLPRGVTPPLARIGQANIRCSLSELLRGRLRATRVELRQVALALVCDPSVIEPPPGAGETDSTTLLLGQLLSVTPRRLPRVSVPSADLQVFVVRRDQPRLVQRLLLRAEGKRTGEGYTLRLDRRPAANEPLAQVVWSAAAGGLEASLDWADLRTIVGLLPPRLAESCQRLALDGRGRLDRLVVRAASRGSGAESAGPTRGVLAAVEVRLADVDCVLPIEEDDGLRASERYLQVTGAEATLVYQQPGPETPEALAVRIEGRLHGAPAALDLGLTADGLARLRAAGACALEDVTRAEARVDRLELPTAKSYPAFVRSGRLPQSLVAALEHYQPRGRVNLRLCVRPAPDTAVAAAERVEMEIESLGAACRYYLFPYELDDAWGRIRVAGGRIHIDDLRGRHRGGQVRASGVVFNSHSWSGFELEFRGQDIALDRELYQALPPEQRHLWERAAPLGLADVVVAVRRPDGSAQTGSAPHQVEVDARLRGGSLLLGDGRRIDHADGWITVRGDVVGLRDLHGYDGEAAVWLDGDIHAGSGSDETDLRVAISDLPVEHQAALAPPGAAAGAALSFAGLADVCGRVYGAGEDSGQHFAVRIKEGRLTGLDPTRHWDVTEGRVNVREQLQEVMSLACRQGQSRLEASGTLPSPSDQDQALVLDLRAWTPNVRELYPQFLPGTWAEIADKLGLDGPGEVSVQLRPEQQDPAAARQAAEIDLQAGRMKPPALPIDLRNVQAHLSISPGRFQLSGVAAELGEKGRITVEQARPGTWGDGCIDADFAVTARDLVLGPELAGGLPGPLARLLEKLAARGEIDALLPSVRISGGPERTWRLEGSLPLEKASLMVGLELADFGGAVSGVCIVQPDGETELDARFSIERGSLGGRAIEHWGGQLRRRVGERWVLLEDLQGQLCDGVAQGSLAIDPSTGEYELSLKLHDVSAAELFPPPPDQPERRRTGRIDGEVWLRGQGGDVASRRGGGSLRISGASFLGTPVLADVARQRKQPASSDRVDRVELRFLWEGQTLRLERIDLQSKDLRMVGAGTWRMRDDAVSMTLVGAHPEHWPRVAVLTDLLESAGRELVQYHVTGKLSAPKVTAEPLYKLNEALRRLIGEE